MANDSKDLEALYGNTPLIKITKKRRYLSFLLDFFIILLIYLPLFSFATKPIITNIAQNDIQEINNITISICNQNNYPYIVNNSNYKLIEIDINKFVEEKMKENITQEKAYDQYFDAYNNLNDKLMNNSEYIKYYSAFHVKNVYGAILTVLIPLIIFQFIIPLINKKTIGNYITKTTICNLKNNQITSNIKISIRFLLILILNIIIPYVILNSLSFITIPLIELMFIIITKNKQTLINLISSTKIIEDKYINLIEE